MPRFVSDPNAEVIGQNVLAFVENIQSHEIRPYLERYDLVDIQPDQWYSLNTWLAVLSDISEASGASNNFVSIGMAISQTSLLPSNGNMTFEEMVENYDSIYQMQHRNGEIGTLVGEMVGPNHARFYDNTPFPCDLDYGVIWGFARRFLPPGTQFIVKYNEAYEQTHEHAVIDVIWK